MMNSFSEDPFQPLPDNSPKQLSSTLVDLAEVAQLASAALDDFNESEFSIEHSYASEQIVHDCSGSPVNEVGSSEERAEAASADDPVASVFDENGTVVNLKTRNLSHHQAHHRSEIVPTKLRGERCKKFLENSCARSKSRSNHVEGLLKKIRDLKTTTHDDVLIEIHTAVKNRTVKRYATDVSLFRNGKEIPKIQPPLQPLPSSSVLSTVSPSKKGKKPTKTRYSCQLCGIEYGSAPDIQYGSNWIGCEHNGCDVWQHIKCMGLEMPRSMKSVKWRCIQHIRERPPKSSLLKQKKNKKK